MTTIRSYMSTRKWSFSCLVNRIASQSFHAISACGTAELERNATQKEWPICETLGTGIPNILHDPIASQDKITSLPFNIKLGLMKQFVKAFNTDDESFKYIVSAIPALSFVKIKAGLLDGLQIFL